MSSLSEKRSSFLRKLRNNEGCCGGCTGNSTMKNLGMTPDELDKTFKMIAQTMSNLEAVMASMEMKSERRHFALLQSLGEQGVRMQNLELRLHSMEMEIDSLKVANIRNTSNLPPGVSQEVTIQTHEPQVDRSGCTVSGGCEDRSSISTGSIDGSTCVGQQDVNETCLAAAGKKPVGKKSAKKSGVKKTKESYSLRGSSASTDRKSRSAKSKAPSTSRSTPLSNSKLRASSSKSQSNARKSSSKGSRKQRK